MIYIQYSQNDNAEHYHFDYIEYISYDIYSI